MPRDLTPKQQLFVEAYLGAARGNATEAARLAGYEGGANALGVAGTRLLRNAKVAEALAGRLETAKSCMSADDVLAELTEIAGASWRDFTEIKVGRGGETLEVIVRLGDKLKALELLGKHHRLFADRMELTGKDGGPVEHVSADTMAEARRRALEFDRDIGVRH